MAALACATILAGCAGPMVVSTDLTRLPVGDNTMLTYAVGVSEIEVKATRSEEPLPDECAAAIDIYEDLRIENDALVARYGRITGRLRETLWRLTIAPPRRESPDTHERGGWDYERSEPTRYHPVADADKRDILRDLVERNALKTALETKAEAASSALETVRTTCPDRPVTYHITSRIVPSLEHLYGLEIVGGGLSDDKLKMEIGTDGLLTSVAATTADVSGTAIVEAAKTIGRFAGPSPWGELIGPDEPAYVPPPPPGMLEVSLLERCGLATLQIDRLLAALSGRPECLDGRGIAELIARTSHWGEAFEGLTPALPQPLRMSLSDFEGFTAFGDEGEVETTCARVDGAEAGDQPRGLVLALPRPCRLIVRLDGVEVARANFMGLDERALYVVPIDRGTLVTNETKLTLGSGRLTVVDIERPSPVGAVVALPGDIVGGIVQGLTGAFTDSENLQNAQAKVFEAEAKLLEARRNALAARTAAAEDEEAEPAADAAGAADD